MTNFKNFCESLEQISFRGKDLIWNPNKTDTEFKKRIKARTGMNEIDFYKSLRAGLKEGDAKIPSSGAICVYYTKTRFVLILDMDTHMIRTIRDAFWDKPSNGCNKKVLVNESVMGDYITNVFFNETEFEGYSIDVIGGDTWLLEIEHHCDICVEVDA